MIQTEVSNVIVHEVYSAAELVAGCQERKPDNAHEPFCFELFRRAVINRCEACWSGIYQQYQRLVYGWVLEYAKSNTVVGDKTIDDLVLDSFGAFWRGYKREQLSKAAGVGQVLGYLKTCVFTSVAQAQRKWKKHQNQLEWDQIMVDSFGAHHQRANSFEENVIDQVSAQFFWDAVSECCRDECDLIIARLSFVSNLKPKSILKMHPDKFVDEPEIYERRRKLRGRLRRNATIQDIHNEVVS